MPSWINDVDPQGLIEKNIFELLDLKDAPEETKQKMINDMVQTVENRIIARILDRLQEPEIRQFEQLLDQDDDNAIKNFFESHKIDPLQIATQEVLNYKIEIINLIAAKEDEAAGDDQN
ncbi:MAG: hypothetical protein BWY68_00415 [bacterium ADurb.Bin400]|nr:MAG: hypothetical protein BWY68_00415 [bacterium ADurb.Bin400]